MDTAVQDDWLILLRRSPLWASQADDVLQAVAAAMESVSYSAGQPIIQQGQPGTHLFVLCSGQAEVRVHTGGATVVTVATFKAGDCFGEMSLLSDDLTTADVVAIEAVETLSLGRSAFNSLVAAHPILLREFMRVITQRLRATNVAVGTAKDKQDQLSRFLQVEKTQDFGDLVGKHQSVRELHKQIDLQAQLDSPLLVRGEPGTGRELTARLVHFRGKRKDAPLFCADCSQIQETQWGDPLFGDYERGNGANKPQALCYIDLAEGGAILLQNIELLPPAIQQRLGRFLNPDSATANQPRRNVRIMATCRSDLNEAAAAGRFAPGLAQALISHAISTPALRDRKRDIPELASHFLRKHAQRLNKKVSTLDDQAITKLVSYDYVIGNLRELEAAIERAVILTDDEKVAAEAVFIGPPPSSRAKGFNLLKLPQPLVRFALRLFPGAFRAFAAVVFAFILYECFFDPVRTGNNIGTLMVWTLWWPSLILSFFLAGRAWCAICPMAFAGTSAQRWFNLDWRVPAWLKDHDIQISSAGFFVIVWAEEVTAMRHSPLASGILLLVILSGAVISGVLFPRRTWCRHLCPLGGLAGICSSASLLELRPTFDICSAKCKGHSCYKGDDQVPGCPMFNHVMFVDANQDCVLCLNCVRSCENGSPQLNLRAPGRDLWTRLSARPEVAQFVVMLAGLVIGMTLLQHWERVPHKLLSGLLAGHRLPFASAVLALSAGLPLLELRLLTKRLQNSADPTLPTVDWQRIVTWLPLVATAFTCYQLAFVPGFDTLRVTLNYQPFADSVARTFSFSLLAVLQSVMLLSGLGITIVAMRKHWLAIKGEEGESWIKPNAVNLSAAAAYCLVIFVLMFAPEWVPH